MQGGKLLCYIDNLFAEPDSLAYKPQTIAYDSNLNLTDLLFRYGARINTDLVMDLQCDQFQFVVEAIAIIRSKNFYIGIIIPCLVL